MFGRNYDITLDLKFEEIQRVGMWIGINNYKFDYKVWVYFWVKVKYIKVWVLLVLKTLLWIYTLIDSIGSEAQRKGKAQVPEWLFEWLRQVISKLLLSVRNSCISLCDVENDLETCCLFVGVVFLVVNCVWLSNGYLLPFHLSMSFALYLRHCCGKRMVY